MHVKGIRHCDLKPANILLDARGRAWIADFGQAHLSCDASPALGTFYYMAPEQANHCNQIPDTRWDVYGLGAIFYAMLTGHPPRETTELQAALKGNTGLSERLRSYRELAKSASTPTAHRRVRGMDRLLAEIIDHCLAIDPERRVARRRGGAVGAGTPQPSAPPEAAPRSRVCSTSGALAEYDSIYLIDTRSRE